MKDIYLRVGDVVANSISNLPTVRIGEDVQLELRFGEGLEYAFGDPVLSTAEERHQRLYQYVQWANDATIKVDRSSSGVSNYHEDVPPRANVETFIHPVQSGSDITRMPDFWAAIRGGEDTREPGNGRTSLRLDVTVLAMIGEYDNSSELKTDLGASVI